MSVGSILYVILRDIQLEKRPILIDIGPPNSHLRYPIELFRTYTLVSIVLGIWGVIPTFTCRKPEILVTYLVRNNER